MNFRTRSDPPVPDLSWSDDGWFTQFLPNTKAGEASTSAAAALASRNAAATSAATATTKAAITGTKASGLASKAVPAESANEPATMVYSFSAGTGLAVYAPNCVAPGPAMASTACTLYSGTLPALRKVTLKRTVAVPSGAPPGK